MLYEKTLSRKTTGTPTQSQKFIGPNGLGPPMNTKGPRSPLTSIWKGLYRPRESLFNTEDKRPSESKMGKILNLMRHGSLAVLLFILRLTLRPVMTSTR